MMDWKPIAEKFKEADAILIGASNGLSITEGLHLFADNAAFEGLFGDFKRKYGLQCILQGMMARWPSEEEKWAFWARGKVGLLGPAHPSLLRAVPAYAGDEGFEGHCGGEGLLCHHIKRRRSL